MHSVLNSNSLRRFRGNVNGCLDLQMRIRRDKLLCWLLGNCIGPCRVRYPLILGYLWVLTDHGVTQFRYLSSSWRRTFGNVNLSSANLKITLILWHCFKDWWGWILQGVLRGLRYFRLESLFETSTTNAILFVLLRRVLDKFSSSHMFILIIIYHNS